jgi:hypothetical protein
LLQSINQFCSAAETRRDPRLRFPLTEVQLRQRIAKGINGNAGSVPKTASNYRLKLK